jgi:chloride channel protein, CIC family
MSGNGPRGALEQARPLLWAVLVGVCGGAAALLLREAATFLPRLVWPAAADLVGAVAAASPVQRVAIPVIGAVLAGLVLTLGERWSGGARGWDILEAVVLRDGILHLRPTLVKALSSLLTVSSAGAVGREGPIVLIAATVSSLLGQGLRVSTRQRRILVGCGIATGLACAYNTPIGAALFTMEIIFGSFALEAFVPLVVSSVVATLLTRAAFGNLPVFRVPALEMAGPWEVLLYAVLGVLGGLVAAAFLVALRSSSALFRRLKLPRPLTMAATGLLLGIVVQGYPELVGNGRDAIAALFERDWALSSVVALLLLRLVVTPLTVGSGAVGGVFTPTLFLGAMLGYAYGSLAHGIAGELASPAAAYALVGMAALLAGTTHAPLTSVLMVFEMTLDYNLALPLLLAAATASLVATTLSRDSVYTEALTRQAQGAGGVIGALTVGDVMRPDHVTVDARLPLPQLLDRFVAARRNHLYVVDADSRFLGAVNLHDVNRRLLEGADPEAFRAGDMVRERFETTLPAERLDRVLDRFERQECERLPVLADGSSRRLVGTVSKRDILGVYSRELLQRSGVPAPSSGPGAPADSRVDEMEVPAALIGESLAGARVRERFGLSVLMLRRGETWLVPEQSTRFETGDRLLAFGAPEALRALRETCGGSGATA